MKCKMRLLLTFLLASVLLAFPSETRADIAPPINPPGSNVQPGGDSTQVRMENEKVVLEVMDDGQEEGLGKAHVTADFIMRNLGAEEETMQVRFPISANNGWGGLPEITGVVVKVNGRTVTTTNASYKEPNYGSDIVPWVEFKVNFPSNVDVAISVAYDLQGSGYYPYTAFYYLLETGAGWKDTIGRADIIVRLPYEANSLNTVQDFQIGWAETNRGAIFDGREVRWLYEDFEPGPYSVVQNMEFALVAPGSWKKVLQAQKEVKASPTDGEAWGRLAKVYKDLFLLGKGYRTDVGGIELFRLSVEAYEECLKLKPSDAQWHAGFADLLANRAYWDEWMSGPTQDVFRALTEIHTALQIAPNDPKVEEIAQNIYWMFSDGMILSDAGYDFPWLTQTPTTRPPTETIAPALDPAKVCGEYTSQWLKLWDGQQAELRLILKSDFSAELETTFQGKDLKHREKGVWKDNGDGLLRFVSAWANGDPYTIVFSVESGHLKAIEYPSYFGDGGVSLEKPAEIQVSSTETAQPSFTVAFKPTWQPESTQTAATQSVQVVTPTPQSTRAADKTGEGAKSVLPCGAMGLAPLAVVGYLWRRKWRRN
jgi:tetratricopeptide (TPR) repeat protein